MPALKHYHKIHERARMPGLHFPAPVMLARCLSLEWDFYKTPFYQVYRVKSLVNLANLHHDKQFYSMLLHFSALHVRVVLYSTISSSDALIQYMFSGQQFIPVTIYD